MKKVRLFLEKKKGGQEIDLEVYPDLDTIEITTWTNDKMTQISITSEEAIEFAKMLYKMKYFIKDSNDELGKKWK